MWKQKGVWSNWSDWIRFYLVITSDNSACLSEDDNANSQNMLQTPPNLAKIMTKEQIKQSNQAT